MRRSRRRVEILGALLVANVVSGCAMTRQRETSEARHVTSSSAVSLDSAEVDVELRRHEVSADDGHVLVVWEKRPAHPTRSILLVHGRTWSARPDFDLRVPGESRSTMDHLVARDIATYAVDLRGYGGTVRDAHGWVTPDRAARDVAAALEFVAEHARVDGMPTLLGWSMGSLVSQLVAQRHPERISGLVLYGHPRAPDAEYPSGPPSDAAPATRATTAEAAASDFVVPEATSAATIRAFVSQALEHDPVKADWRALDQFEELEPERVKVPTLLLHGEADPFAPIEHQAALFVRLGHPDRAWVVLPGADHAAHLESAGPRFIDAVVSFMDRPVSSSGLPRSLGVPPDRPGPR